uniref:Uncharacterized protein n=1 Tax=Aureoumbra lagunensis TaxID=44058 RepID=A0A6S8ASE2_9STRA
MAFHPEFSVVYVTNEVSEGRISALRFEKQKFSTKGSGPISDGLQWNISIGLLFFGNGGVALFDIESDGAIGQRRAEYNSSKELKMHDVAFHDGYLFAVDTF